MVGRCVSRGVLYFSSTSGSSHVSLNKLGSILYIGGGELAQLVRARVYIWGGELSQLIRARGK